MKKTQQNNPIANLNRLEANYQLSLKKGTMKKANKISNISNRNLPLHFRDNFRLFNNERVVSPWARKRLSPAVQKELWEIIRQMKWLCQPTIDRVQIFHLAPFTSINTYQEIVAENDPIWTGRLIGASEYITAVVYIVDNGRYTRMLLEDEFKGSRDPYLEP